MFSGVLQYDRPFCKKFDPATIAPGEVSTLRFTIDRTVTQDGPGTNLHFTDALPTELVVASPPNAVNGCSGTLTATAGSTSISLVGGFLVGTACDIFVDVTSATEGSYLNTVQVGANPNFSDIAAATLTVPEPSGPLGLVSGMGLLWALGRRRMRRQTGT